MKFIATAILEMRLIPITAGDEELAVRLDASDSDEALGTIGIWRIDAKAPQSYEMGWFVLPAHQRAGVATEAARLLLSQARADPAVRYIHAYPSITNVASNAIARKIGMQNRGEFDNEGFAGVLRCNDWRIDVGRSHHRKEGRVVS